MLDVLALAEHVRVSEVLLAALVLLSVVMCFMRALAVPTVLTRGGSSVGSLAGLVDEITKVVVVVFHQTLFLVFAH